MDSLRWVQMQADPHCKMVYIAIVCIVFILLPFFLAMLFYMFAGHTLYIAAIG